ncbi:MAG: hypothetical protein ABSC93_13320 [Bryobacteraceae bacterium]|jgi:hypothetical protein
MEALFSDGKELQPWWRGRSWRFWLTVLSPLLVMGACGLFSLHARRVAAEAEREAAVFHQRLAGGQFDIIYQTAAPAFRASLNQADADKFFSAIRDKMGVCKMPAEALTYFTNASTSGTRVQLRYRLQCANGALDETMLYAFDGGAPQLAGYNATSPALPIR